MPVPGTAIPINPDDGAPVWGNPALPDGGVRMIFEDNEGEQTFYVRPHGLAAVNADDADFVLKAQSGGVPVGTYTPPSTGYRRATLSLEPTLYYTLGPNGQAYDLSTHGNDGTADGGLVYGTVVSSPVAGSVYSTAFDPGGPYRIHTDYAPFINGTIITMMGWAYRNDNLVTHTLMGSDNSTACQLRLNSNNNDVAWKSDQVGTPVTWSGAWPGTGVWVHWAFVFNEPMNLGSLYINGALVSTATVPVPYDNPGELKIGARGTSANGFNGSMAHVSFFERRLSDTDIAGAYAARLLP